MQIINLYRYEEENGIVITPHQRNADDIPHAYRLIADEGKALTRDNIEFCECIDIDNADGWLEVDYVEEEITEDENRY